MDWQLSVANPAITPVFWGLIRTAPDKRDPQVIDAGKAASTTAMQMMDAQLTRTRFIAGDQFSYGDIPIGPFAYRYFRLVTDHPPLPHVERWYAEMKVRPAFKQHVLDVPFV
jgi:glutathione S-transferase